MTTAGATPAPAPPPPLSSTTPRTTPPTTTITTFTPGAPAGRKAECSNCVATLTPLRRRSYGGLNNYHGLNGLGSFNNSLDALPFPSGEYDLSMSSLTFSPLAPPFTSNNFTSLTSTTIPNLTSTNEQTSANVQ
ncbi:uncharacterized protein C8R40DRAFT_1067325 [Lentinula edodes]|uniref:uncharacterized protein n=1 Tax=Lentinula edodes TaxID=5353 RepID=UPI001E8EB838|nr:uncharacterized protein C8R40DRAFT_1067325 [Lentinula edodes]KAH7878298.1 hypothetical protein C8R40DRAFT_1067325 [Lentinula edodes]